MKEYRVIVSVKNNYLWTKMKEAGLWTAAELSRVSGVPQGAIGKYLNLQLSAKNRKGWRENVEKLAGVLRCMPEDLFPPQHIDSPLVKNKAEFEVDLNDVEWLLGGREQRALLPDDRIAKQEVSDALIDALCTLSDRDLKVLSMNFGLAGGEAMNGTEIAEELGLSKARVYQIIAKGLRRLKGDENRAPVDLILVARGEMTDNEYQRRHPKTGRIG